MRLEQLEQRQLLTANLGLAGGEVLPQAADEPAPFIAESFGLTDEFYAQLDAQAAEDPTVAIALPEQFADELRIEVEVDGETQTLVLERNVSSRSSAFQVLVQQDDGTLVAFDAGEERNYVGYVEERPGIQVSAVISSRGLSAEAYQLSGEFVWEIRPTDEFDANGDPLHRVSSTNVLALLDVNHDHDGDGFADHAASEHVDPEAGGGHGPGCTCAACSAAQTEAAQAEAAEAGPAVEALIDDSNLNNVPASRFVEDAPNLPDQPNVSVPQNPSSRAVLFNEVAVREVVVGFDVTFESFRDAYNSSVQAVVDNIELFLNTNERTAPSTTSPNIQFLRDAALHQVAGLIIIRNSGASDPYADPNDNFDADLGSDLLNQFRDRWNGNDDTNNPNLVRRGDVNRLQSDHDHVTLLGGSAGLFTNNNGETFAIDGLAFVGQVGQGGRYSTSDGTSVSFWRAVARHEIGHVWGLPHSFGRAESDPAGNGFGIMSPIGGLGNRLSTDEVIRLTEEADESSSNLSVISSPAGVPAGTFTDHNVRPHGTRDDVVLLDGQSSIIIDVLANDYDVNNDPLFLASYEATTDAGGTVELILGGGDRGQDVLRYTPPQNFSGADLFYYNVGDVPQFGTGQNGDPFQQFGAVSIIVESTDLFLDQTATSFDFDFGPFGSPVLQTMNFNGIGVAPETTADVFFTRNGQPIGPSEVGSLDRGVIEGVNAANRDGIISSEPVTVNFRVPNGRYNVAVNLADPLLTRDNQTVSVGGELVIADLDNIVDLSDPDDLIRQNPTEDFEAIVTDGVLSLTFDDLGGVNDEFVLNRVSLDLLESFAEPRLPGDLNTDRVVNAADYTIFRDLVGSQTNPFSGADANGSAEVETGDYDVISQNFGASIADVALIDETEENGNGSFEDLTGATPDLGGNRIGGGGSTALIPGFTAVSSGFGGFDDANSNAPTDGVEYAFINSGGEITVTSDPVDHTTAVGDVFTVSVDVGNNRDRTHNYEVRLIFGAETQVFEFTDDTNVTPPGPGQSGDDLSTFTFEFTATGNEAGATPVVEVFANNSGGNAQVFIDNLRFSVETVVPPGGASSLAALAGSGDGNSGLSIADLPRVAGALIGPAASTPILLSSAAEASAVLNSIADSPQAAQVVVVVDGPLRRSQPGSAVAPTLTPQTGVSADDNLLLTLDAAFTDPGDDAAGNTLVEKTADSGEGDEEGDGLGFDAFDFELDGLV